ncbi:triple QxxK/R motif-containing protein [Nematostella vectensis]|uniref:triple QxxK/R motif-containing protein n=1 Tax=Nematostella vectensis TaxID=45351 RepID=UPI001390597F|nr:triple QxxK/R motif-containing protein [Nematostella vectensis]
MARKDVVGKSEIEGYRKSLGKQEFKGRSKKQTLAAKEKAQARKSGNPINIILLYILFLLAVLVAIYFIFYIMTGGKNL